MTDLIEHGRFSVTPKGQVLLCEIQGAWNKEGSEQLIEDVKSQVQALAGKKWARVMDMQGWELVTPDAISLLTAFSDWEDQHGCVLRCFIGLNTIQQQLLDMKYQHSHKPQHFSHLDTAMGYAKQFLQRL
jgi:protein-tyrosine phosphatase